MKKSPDVYKKALSGQNKNDESFKELTEQVHSPDYISHVDYSVFKS
jgi:hypothetical protein